MKTLNLFGFFILGLIIDLAVLMLRGLNTYIIYIVGILCICQVIILFIMNEYYRRKTNEGFERHFQISLMVGGLFFFIYIFVKTMEAQGLTTIFSGLI